MSTAAEVARAFGGHRSGGGFLIRCPVAGHGQGKGDRTPSLLVKDGDRRLLVKCFAGCAVEDILTALRGWGHFDDIAERSERHRELQPQAPPRPARRIWQTTVPLDGTVGETYLLVHRGLVPPFPSCLRLLDHQAPKALVAAVYASDGTITAVQLTYLSSSGTKAAVSPVRRTIGSLADGAVRMGDSGVVLGLAEGVEDALAAFQLAEVPSWACLGAGRMHRVAIPTTVRELHVFADDDEPGREAAERTADIHRQLGRRVVLRLPPPGLKDWGEVAQRMRVAA